MGHSYGTICAINPTTNTIRKDERPIKFIFVVSPPIVLSKKWHQVKNKTFSQPITYTQKGRLQRQRATGNWQV